MMMKCIGCEAGYHSKWLFISVQLLQKESINRFSYRNFISWFLWTWGSENLKLFSSLGLGHIENVSSSNITLLLSYTLLCTCVNVDTRITKDESRTGASAPPPLTLKFDLFVFVRLFDCTLIGVNRQCFFLI